MQSKMKIQIKSVIGTLLFEGDFTSFAEAIESAVSSRANLNGANLNGANLYGANLYGKKAASLRVFSGLYKYAVQAVLFEDGSRWVRMGCLFKSLEEWEQIGIAKSNLNEFPDDGSEKSKERIAAFEFAKAAALRLAI